MTISTGGTSTESRGPDAPEDWDPVLSQIIYNYELTLNREMGRAVVNLSGSPLFVGASDFACGCLDAEGNILTSIAWSLQMGYAVSNTVRASLRRYRHDIHPGDMIFCNDPYGGGGLHSSDVVVVAPVFTDGELSAWVGVSAHVTDVGGAVPGGFSVEPMECFGENIRFTPVKFYERGVYRGDLVDAFLTNVRLPERTGIDLKALMGATWIGRERMAALFEQHGADRVRAVHAAQIQQSDSAMRERLAVLPDGVYEGAAHMEHDGAEDRVYTIRMRVVKEGDRITFDYTGTDAQAPGILNSAEVGSTGNVVAALATVLAPDIPFNEGLMHPVTIESPRGTLVNAIKPAPISGATIYGAWFGTDAILEALNYMVAGHQDHEHRRTGPWGSWTFAWLYCTNQYGEPWFFNVFTAGSGGASAMPFRDGEPAMMGVQTVGSFTANIEDYELQSPVLFLQRAFAPDTGGAGRHRGGLALESLCVPWDTPKWDTVVFHNRLSTPSSAVSGGLPGAGSSLRFARDILGDVRDRWTRGEPLPIREYAESAERTPTRARGLVIEAEDGYYMRATGGPGYGDPLDRPVEEVAEDLRREFVSPTIARDAYGAVLASDGTPDADGTARHRADLKRERAALPLTADAMSELRRRNPPAPSGSADRTEPQVLGEYLELAGTGYRCRCCGHVYCDARDNWKWHAAFQQATVSPSTIQSPIRERDDLYYRQYFCPGCGVQAETEVALPDEPPRWNFRPLSVWRAQQDAQAGASLT
ncbi:hydantoinase B/oxoprolinase family protein [Streptomyces sp. NPDC056227]|uniref:hydantoinase B/oxoprolinase family protein n=1 Tax=Streptomyces sp. NPDC056227 TaxID=3345753 RepID=UPI0035DB61B0